MAKIPNMNQLMKMAQDMSKQMEDKMSSIEAEGNAGGGMVKVILNGHKNILSIEISKEVVDPEEIEMLQDLITAALNDAISKVDEELKDNLGSSLPGGLPGGMPFPGF
ncbi:MAG: YbaB/EbfC family nucleoid-associated protein [Candidatus Aminicenantes bacterium]|nr:YbaB/EbfC family nucleoid-associated protein [Candidatus Aminicenantes bacterium]